MLPSNSRVSEAPGQLLSIARQIRMTTENPESSTELGVHQAARLEKLRRLEALGVDPWGHRFDNRLLNRDVRAMADQVQYQTEDGRKLALPIVEGEGAVDYRAWKTEQGAALRSGRSFAWPDASSCFATQAS